MREGGASLDAELIAVGTELLLGQIANSHAQYLSGELAAIGVSVYYHTAVGDNLSRAASVVRTALERSDIVIVTGGLGPTEDDLTREAVALACESELSFSDEAYEEHVLPYFHRVQKPAPEANRRQALRVGNAEFLHNPRGTAPGQVLRVGAKHVFLLPGPPLEMRPMFEEAVRPRLLQMTGEGYIYSRVLRIFGLGEAEVEARVRDLVDGINPTVAPLAGEGEMILRVTAKAADKERAVALASPVEAELLNRLGPAVYGFDDETLPTLVLRELGNRGESVALAESCTGGMLASMLVDIPGSSHVFKGDVVAYDNAVKCSLLDVNEESLLRDGAVSVTVARQMAVGARGRFGATYSVSVTGIAGPAGGTADKPVGLVYIGVASADRVSVQRHVFAGDRSQIRIRAATAALHALLTEARKG